MMDNPTQTKLLMASGIAISAIALGLSIYRHLRDKEKLKVTIDASFGRFLMGWLDWETGKMENAVTTDDMQLLSQM